MIKATGFVLGCCLGIAGMSLMDPVSGRRRRALVRDKGKRVGHYVSRNARTSVVDLSHRFRGFLLETRADFTEKSVSDDLLVARVRSQLGRAVSHSHGVQVECQGGKVILHGTIAEDELAPLLKTVRSVRGVREVESQLKPFRSESASVTRAMAL